jgi:hypothetical protein
MSKKYNTIFFTNFLGGLFLGLGVDDPETAIINAFDTVFNSLGNEANLMWTLAKIVILISGILEFIYLLRDSKSRIVLFLGLTSGFLIVNSILSGLGAFLFVIGILLSNYLHD